MTDKSILNSSVIQKGGAWHAAPGGARPYSVINTGFSQLDKSIRIGGWPLGTSTEIGVDDYGIGELRMLMPALRNVLSSNRPYVVWIAPPYLPYSRALLKEHIDPSFLVVVNSSRVSDTLWAAEQVLLSNSCSALFIWTGGHNLSHKETRRLQLATEKSGTWHVQFRHQRCLQQASAARMRLRLQSNAQGELLVNIDKQPLGVQTEQCLLSLSPHYEQWQRIPTEQLPQHNRPRLNNGFKQQTSTSKMRGLSRKLLIDEN